MSKISMRIKRIFIKKPWINFNYLQLE